MDGTETNRPPLPLLFQLFSPNNYSHGSSAVATPLMSIAMVDDPSLHVESVELRSRNTTKMHSVVSEPNRHEHLTMGGGSGGKVPLMEHFVKSGESLTQISLQYSVPVSEIKRINNIVADHEIHGLPMLKIPVTRAFLLRRQMIEADEKNEGRIIDILGEEGTSSATCDNLDVIADNGNHERATHRNMSNNREFGTHRAQAVNRQPHASEKLEFTPMLNGRQNDALHGSDESLSAHAKEVIEGILDETDRNMATARQNLPSPSLEGGSFHFVDAGAPDNNSSNVWLIVAVVLIIFVLLPLALTFLEENGEMEEHRRQGRPQQ